MQIKFLNIFQDNFHRRSLKQRDMFSQEQVRCSISVSLHQCSIFVFIYTLLLPEGERGEAGQPIKKYFQESGNILRPKCCAMTKVSHHAGLASIPAQSIWDYGKQRGTTTDFSPSTSVLSCHYYSTNVPHLSPATCCSYQQDKQAKTASLQKSNALSNSESTGGKGIFNFCLKD